VIAARPILLLEFFMSAAAVTWLITALAAAAIALRPFNWPEFVWAIVGAAVLLALRTISPEEAVVGVVRGADLYLFLFGMMLLAEIARAEGLFDWFARLACQHAGGSGRRLFLLIYGVGTLVTIFLSNDATAVVLTPAVAVAVRAAKAEHPLPYLLVCAFIANAASFVLPISNPANLVIYGNHMPALLQWLPRYLLPSILSIVATYVVLRWTQRSALDQEIARDLPVLRLSRGGKIAAAGIAITAVMLLIVSAADIQLGAPTAIAGVVTGLALLVRDRKAAIGAVKSISWGIFPLVGGLFVMVEALDQTGLADLTRSFVQRDGQAIPWSVGLVVALASNLFNNLPVGLVAGSTVQAAHVADSVTSAVLIGVDLGPNLSVTGSLATILWLAALRRERLSVSPSAFLKLGCVVMPPALVLALAAALH
jgi:arsenical pump membrane protein